MSDALKDILSNSNKDIDNQQLMDYLSNHLSKPQEHEVEKQMADDPFMNDAIEGLQDFSAQKNIQPYVEQLNNELQKKLAKNKSRKEKRKWKDQPLTYITIAVILVLLVICYIVIKKYSVH